MIKRTEYTFDFPMRDEMDSAEFHALISVINEIYPDGAVYGEAIKSDVFQIRVQTVDVP